MRLQSSVEPVLVVLGAALTLATATQVIPITHEQGAVEALGDGMILAIKVPEEVVVVEAEVTLQTPEARAIPVAQPIPLLLAVRLYQQLLITLLVWLVGVKLTLVGMPNNDIR